MKPPSPDAILSEQSNGEGQTPHEAKVGAKDSELDRLLTSRILEYKLNELRLVNEFRVRKQETKVSVVMPTWNRAYIIERAIDSVLSQSYSNLELIISDDGSTDNTAELIRLKYEYEPRVAYVMTAHTGVSHARNVALDRSTGELIAYLDSDNYWSPDYLLLMVNAFIDHPGTDTAYCGVQVVDSVSGQKVLQLRDYDRKRLLKRNYIDLNIFMHRRSLYENFGGFNEQLTALVDWELILRYTRNKAPLVLQCVLARYFLDKNSRQITYTEDLWKNYEMVRRLYDQQPGDAIPDAEIARADQTEEKRTRG